MKMVWMATDWSLTLNTQIHTFPPSISRRFLKDQTFWEKNQVMNNKRRKPWYWTQHTHKSTRKSKDLWICKGTARSGWCPSSVRKPRKTITDFWWVVHIMPWKCSCRGRHKTVVRGIELSISFRRWPTIWSTPLCLGCSIRLPTQPKAYSLKTTELWAWWWKGWL